jgi:hypothetical protein
MIRLNIIVEGHTEERFVKEVLAVHLAQFQVYAVARKVETSRHGKKIFKGGMTTYQKLKKDCLRWMLALQQLKILDLKQSEKNAHILEIGFISLKI